ncbi:MAG: AbrB/MazE/SpoVT family DNA-binding domain-containing protein [Acidaminococcaceae bacterium]|jgi:AbrB family looped-hinge helix DNA binding protein|nr:AbrB/MazE/SpoVT family DNA-binding domain-containing protein [Acidaminococcaceae bacterium]
MELAKVTTKGQITIPREIREKLGIKAGDKLLFVEEAGKIIIINSSMATLKEVQRDFAGSAKQAGLSSADDVTVLVKKIRKERAVK